MKDLLGRTTWFRIPSRRGARWHRILEDANGRQRAWCTSVYVTVRASHYTHPKREVRRFWRTPQNACPKCLSRNEPSGAV